jgi:Phage integrase family.
MENKKSGGFNRKTLKAIQYYPSPNEIYDLLMQSEGWPYAEKKDFYLARDRALASLLYLGALRISEAIGIRKSQFIEKQDHVLIRAIKLSKSKVKGKPRRIEYRDVRLPLTGEREQLTMLILDYARLVKEDRLFPFSLAKDKNGQTVGCKRAWQVVKALLPQFTAHWLRAFGEDFLYSEWSHDILAVADYVKVDARTLQEYLRKRHEKYPAV